MAVADKLIAWWRGGPALAEAMQRFTAERAEIARTLEVFSAVCAVV